MHGFKLSQVQLDWLSRNQGSSGWPFNLELVSLAASLHYRPHIFFICRYLLKPMKQVLLGLKIAGASRTNKPFKSHAGDKALPGRNCSRNFALDT